MKSKEAISTLIKKTYAEAIKKLAEDYSGSSLTDIFITVDKESGEVVVFDDEENRVTEVVVFDWINQQNKLKDDYIVSILKDVTLQLEQEEAFAALELYKPFSVNYADDNMTVIEELLLLTDESTIQIDNDLLEKFDREFDDFLEKLMKE